MDYSRFIRDIGEDAKSNFLKNLSSTVMTCPPTLISLGGGKPNASTFPFESIKVKAKGGIEFTLEGKDLSRALQYTANSGVPELVSWLSRIQERYHAPPLLKDGNLGFIVTVGCQDGLYKIFQTLLSPGDNVLVESLIYPGTQGALKPWGVNLIGIEMDEFGLRQDSLLKALSKWNPKDAADPTSGIPKVLYTVPNCGNPTGITTTADRKKEIYKIAQLYNLIIVEDDPYFFLQFQEEKAPSYQSMDVDGRVIRGDSLSKIISSGLRVGWVSAAKPFIERILCIQQSSVVHCSTLSQILALNLFEQWGIEGFEKHITSIQQFYKSQRDAVLKSTTKWLTGLAEWNVPQGGLFLWIRIPKISNCVEDIFKKGLEKDVLVLPGECFLFEAGVSSSHCRISYSSATPAELEEGIRRLAEVIRDALIK